MSERQKISVFITKYALTSGITQVEAEICSDISEKMISTVENGYTHCYHKPHWHTTKEEANAQVRKMIEEKIKSLKKSLAKMQALQKTYG